MIQKKAAQSSDVGCRTSEMFDIIKVVADCFSFVYRNVFYVLKLILTKTIWFSDGDEA